jgi:hypothetical protein
VQSILSSRLWAYGKVVFKPSPYSLTLNVGCWSGSDRSPSRRSTWNDGSSAEDAGLAGDQ